MTIKHSKCPNCASNNTGIILYGEPSVVYPVDEKVRFSGCCFTSESPEYFCRECDHEWNKKEILIKSYSEIENIFISIGGYWSGVFTVDIDFNRRKLKWMHMHAGKETVFEKSLRIGTVNRLRELLIDINLLNWKTNYVDLDILDGTQWSIKIRKNDEIKVVNGSNAYPKDWDRLIKEIKKITGKPFH